MIQLVIAAFILIGIYRFMKTENNIEIDWWMAFVFVLVPSLISFLIVFLGVGMLGLPGALALLVYPLYFLVPFGVLKLGFEFKAITAAKFAIVVPIVVIALEIIYVLIFGL